MAHRKSGTSKTQGGSEERILTVAYGQRRRWKTDGWSDLRKKVGLAGDVQLQVFKAITKAMAKKGVIKLEESNGQVCVFTDC